MTSHSPRDSVSSVVSPSLFSYTGTPPRISPPNSEHSGDSAPDSSPDSTSSRYSKSVPSSFSYVPPNRLGHEPHGENIDVTSYTPEFSENNDTQGHEDFGINANLTPDGPQSPQGRDINLQTGSDLLAANNHCEDTMDIHQELQQIGKDSTKVHVLESRISHTEFP